MTKESKSSLCDFYWPQSLFCLFILFISWPTFLIFGVSICILTRLLFSKLQRGVHTQKRTLKIRGFNGRQTFSCSFCSAALFVSLCLKIKLTPCEIGWRLQNHCLCGFRRFFILYRLLCLLSVCSLQNDKPIFFTTYVRAMPTLLLK